jgi:hypothetical protein
MNDKIVVCHKDDCKGVCYVTEITPDISSYYCISCGFCTNTLMKEGEKFLEEQSSMLPELYKDLFFKDNEGKIWFPAGVNIPDKGMIFADGINKDNWMWTAVLATKIEESEKHKYPNPNKKGEFYEYKMNMDTKKNFERGDYIEALEYIGIEFAS